MSLNNLLVFIRQFVGWREEGQKPATFAVLAQQEYRDGTLLKVSRESITKRPNTYQLSTFVWIPKNKTKPFLYLFLDNLEGLGIRNLSHRIQILSSDRYIVDDCVETNIHLSESFWMGNNAQANAIALKLIFYCHSRDYHSCDWAWEIDTCRKQVLVYDYTDFSQTKARETGRYVLDRYEMRHPSPLKLSPLMFDHINVVLEPKKEPPKSRVVELLIIGSVLIALTLIVLKVGR